MLIAVVYSLVLNCTCLFECKSASDDRTAHFQIIKEAIRIEAVLN